MPVLATQLYNSGYEALMQDGLSGAGTLMWVLVENDYNPDLTDTTGADFAGNELVAPGAPINATNVLITKTPGLGIESFFQAGSAAGTGIVEFGPGVMTYRYLCLVRPVGAGTYATTSELIFYIDLIDSDSNDVTASGEYVTVNMANSGWFKMVQ